jgi:hypothetical protein
MTEEELGAKMIEVARLDMALNKKKAAWGTNPDWNSDKHKNNVRNGGGRPTTTKAEIFKMLEQGFSVDEIVSKLGCTRSAANQYRRERFGPVKPRNSQRG